MRPKTSTQNIVLPINMKNMNYDCLKNPTYTVNNAYYHNQIYLNKKELLKTTNHQNHVKDSKLQSYQLKTAYIFMQFRFKMSF